MNKICKILIFIFTIHLSMFAQEEYYPPESYYGGGVGFSQMFIYQDFSKLGLTSKLPLPFDTNKYDLPLVISGGEGFSSLTQNITIGNLHDRTFLIAYDSFFVDEVIKSSNLEIIDPEIILIEDNSGYFPLKELEDFFDKKNYSLISICGLTKCFAKM